MNFVEEGFVQLIAKVTGLDIAALRSNIIQIKQALMGPAPTPAEEMLVDLILGAWLQRAFLSKTFTDLMAGPMVDLVRQPGGDSLLGMWIKIQDVPVSRLHQGLRLLSVLRENAAKQIGPPGLAQGGMAEATAQMAHGGAPGGPGGPPPGAPGQGPGPGQAAPPEPAQGPPQGAPGDGQQLTLPGMG